MEQRYKDMFDEVHASDRLRQEVLNMTKQERKSIRKKLSRTTLIAAVVAVLLAGTALAVNVPGIQGWFENKWAESSDGGEMSQEQAQIIQGMTQDVQKRNSVTTSELPANPESAMDEVPTGANDASGSAVSDQEAAENVATENVPEQEPAPAKAGTVTLDSVTAGENCLWMLLHVSGQYTPGRAYRFERIHFDGMPTQEVEDPGIQLNGSFVYSKEDCKVLEDGSLELMILYKNTPGAPSLLEQTGTCELSLQNLMADRETVCPGKWELTFALTPKAVPEPVIVDSVQVTNQITGALVELSDLKISATGLQYFCTPDRTMDALFLDVDLILEDGTEVTDMSAGSTWENGVVNSRWVTEYIWEVPVAPSKAVALRIDGVEIPLK